jgi:hypothetical protein
MRDKLLGAIGYFYICLGVTLNPWVLGRLLAPDGKIESPRIIAIIVLVELLLIAIGGVTLWKRRAAFLPNLHLVIASLAIGCPLAGELVFRTGIGLKIAPFRSPGLYADWFSDDDYWKLQQHWVGLRPYAAAGSVHPRLGWSQEKVTPENPLGLHPRSLERLASTKPKILFYGDSFVDGSSDDEFHLPEYLNNRLDSVDVVDLSVGGYGIDQIYLLFSETVGRVARPTVLVGILVSDDLDRAVLSVRTSQKPYFVLDSVGELKLEGIPVQKDQASYFRTHPSSVRSYLLSFLRLRLLGPDSRIERKKAIASRLLDRFSAEARRAGADLIFVLFYAEWDLRERTWKESYLKAELGARKLPFIDTKAVILTYVERSGGVTAALYEPRGGHHNNLGNEVIGQGILEYLRRR